MIKKLMKGIALGALALTMAGAVQAKLDQYEETYFYTDDNTQVSIPNCSDDPTPECAQKFFRNSPSEAWQPVKVNGENVYVMGFRLD